MKDFLGGLALVVGCIGVVCAIAWAIHTTGGAGESCNRDGSCSYPALECRIGSEDLLCMPKGVAK